jgi:hypothetical protein
LGELESVGVVLLSVTEAHAAVAPLFFRSPL